MDPPFYFPLGQETWNESLVAGMAQASGRPLLNHLFLKVCLLVAVVVNNRNAYDVEWFKVTIAI